MFGCEASQKCFVVVMMNSPHCWSGWLWRPNPSSLPWALGGVDSGLFRGILGPCQNLYIKGGRFKGARGDLEVVGEIAM